MRNSEESREHGAEFLGTGELSKSEFRGTPSFIFGEQGNNVNFYREQGNMHPPPGRPSIEES